MADQGASGVTAQEDDVTMTGSEEKNNALETVVDVDDDDDNNDLDIDDDDAIPQTQDDSLVPSLSANPHTNFLDYLKSPLVTLEVGSASEPTIISAHRAILARAPYFSETLADPKTVKLPMPEEDVDAMGCFLQYQYTGEYFPRRIDTVSGRSIDGLETDPSIPSVDTTGEQLLKHARVYTLAEKLGLPDLKNLAHSKIHRINSTAVGEIAYARYVYNNTSASDVTIRRPVAAFWATRSHVLRHEAEQEFRNMCLEFPQFGFDVLSLVLDAREKRVKEREEPEQGTPQSGPRGRKRARPSVNV